MFNNLTSKQMEQLFCLAEESGEVVQAVNKILRHGYESYSPFDEAKTTNRQALERELGNVYHWIQELADASDLSMEAIETAAWDKSESCKPFMHHQDESHPAIKAEMAV